MTTLLEQLEMMREKMRQMADNEQQLVRGLGEALNVADERLREQVRQFASEHNQRRTVALEELRALSSKLGALPKGRYDSVRQTAQPLESDRYLQQQGAAYQRAAPQPSYASQPPQYGAPAQSRYEPAAPAYAPQPPPPAPASQAQPGTAAPVTGDWRHAASRIEEEINLYQNNLRTRAR